MINTSGITSLYTALTDVISARLDALYSADKIDAETYAKITAQSFDDALKLAVSAIQQQEQIEKDNSVKDAQIQLTNQQKANLLLEADNIVKQGALIEAQTLHTSKQASIAEQEILVKTEQVLIAKEELKVATAKLANIPKEGIVLDKQALDIAAKTTLTGQQTTNLAAEALNIPKQGTVLTNQAAHLAQQTTNLVSEELSIDAKTALMTQQTANAVIEGTVLAAQKCKLDAEYDHIMGQTTKTASETALLAQKKVTEQAQVSDVGVSDNSVIGKQKTLYAAQAEGFKRDAEQKAATILVDTWKVRRSTDEAEPASAENMLYNPTIAKVVNKLLAGVGA